MKRTSRLRDRHRPPRRAVGGKGSGAGKGRGKKRIGSPGGPAPAPPMAQIPPCFPSRRDATPVVSGPHWCGFASLYLLRRKTSLDSQGVCPFPPGR